MRCPECRGQTARDPWATDVQRCTKCGWTTAQKPQPAAEDLSEGQAALFVEQPAPSRDWSDRESQKRTKRGAKDLQTDEALRKHAAECIAAYEKRRRKFPKGRYVMDLDQIEYRIGRNDQIQFVCLLELSHSQPYKVEPAAGYLQTIIDRYYKADNQQRLVLAVADALGIPAFVVVFRLELHRFWVHRLKHEPPGIGEGWVTLEADEYWSRLEARQPPVPNHKEPEESRR